MTWQSLTLTVSYCNHCFAADAPVAATLDALVRIIPLRHFERVFAILALDRHVPRAQWSPDLLAQAHLKRGDLAE